ncbi:MULTISPECIES: anti-sigma factor [unclassified Pseudomonas]|uniref:anti-sigma factor n=1 Tax=unclassified Pseudomonas TaxID=196821 RepID=UPI002362E18A|nr:MULTISPECIES: anti-sigma factor [unclassified Pseudomonas]MDR6178350.1 anti-sigma-K factor RskA [Pseudomonas sp. SORGH_AS_0211]
MNDDIPSTDRHALLIAEYALGVLSAEERLQVEELVRREPAHQAQLAAWQRHFAEWLDEFPVVEPPAHVWQGIQQRLFPTEQPAPEPIRRWNDPRLWRWATGLALVAALVLAVLMLMRPVQVATPALLARLEQSNGSLAFSVTLQGNGRQLLFVPAGKPDWPDRSAEAWIITADGKAHALGLLQDATAVTLTVPAGLAPALTPGAVLAVSLEPRTGSPTGAPTGPIIAKGKIIAL